MLWPILQQSSDCFGLAINEFYKVNKIGAYNVIDAATKMVVQKVIFASCETTCGICFAMGY